MKDLKKISFIIALSGIFILLIILGFSQTLNKDINEINKKDLGKIVTIRGTVKAITDYDSFIILKISDKTGEIRVISEKFNITKNEQIELQGLVQEYKSEIQLNARKISIIS